MQCVKHKMKIQKTELPKVSLLHTTPHPYHYVDSYQGMLYDVDNSLTSGDVGKAFFSSGPKWVEKLFALRNKIVAGLGLKTAGDIREREQKLAQFKCEPNEQMGLFKVFAKTEHEVILGEDDKHLDFRVSLLLQPQENESTKKALTISTTVVFHNWLGRFYFLPVRPFHKLIVPRMLKGMITSLETRKG